MLLNINCPVLKISKVQLYATPNERKKYNVYSKTREQCEIKLAEMIEGVKAEIAEKR